MLSVLVSVLKEMLLGKPKTEPVVPTNKLGITVTLTPENPPYDIGVIWNASADYKGKTYEARGRSKVEVIRAVRAGIKKEIDFESIKAEEVEI